MALEGINKHAFPDRLKNYKDGKYERLLLLWDHLESTPFRFEIEEYTYYARHLAKWEFLVIEYNQNEKSFGHSLQSSVRLNAIINTNDATIEKVDKSLTLEDLLNGKEIEEKPNTSDGYEV